MAFKVILSLQTRNVYAYTFEHQLDILGDARIKERAEEVKRKVHADIGIRGVVDRIEKLLISYEQCNTLKS